MPRTHKFDLDAYTLTIRPMQPDEGEGFLVEYPDVPYCIADGKTPADAIRHGRKALEACLTTMARAGDPIPKPGGSSATSGQWRQWVPKSMHGRLVEQAEREGVSLSTLVTALIAEGIGQKRASRKTR